MLQRALELLPEYVTLGAHKNNYVYRGGSQLRGGQDSQGAGNPGAENRHRECFLLCRSGRLVE